MVSAILDYDNVVETAYVKTSTVPGVTYFAQQLELGPRGINKYLNLPDMNLREQQLFKKSLTNLKKAIKVGEVNLEIGNIFD